MLRTSVSDISYVSDSLQEFPDTALFLSYVRNLASLSTEGDTPMKSFLLAVVLMCAVALPAIAGDMPSGDAPQPPTPGSNRPKSTFSDRKTTLTQVAEPQSDQASLDPWQSLMLAILSLLAR
jgi:hypothetical protein